MAKSTPSSARPASAAPSRRTWRPGRPSASRRRSARHTTASRPPRSSARRAGVGAVVHPRRVAPRRVEHLRQHVRRDRAETHGQRQRLAPAAAERHQHDHDDGPQEVELLLHRQRPHVAQRRGAHEVVEVRLPRRDQVPVLDVEDRRQHVAPELRQPLAHEQRPHDDDDGDHGHERREQAPGPTLPEPRQRHRARRRLLAEEQLGDEVAADGEEDLHAEEPAGHPGDTGVVQEHGRDRDPAQAVEAGHVRQAGGRGARRGPGRGGSRVLRDVDHERTDGSGDRHLHTSPASGTVRSTR